MMLSLKDLAQELMEKKSIANSYGEKYFIKSINNITDPITGNTGWKATITSRGYVYSSSELGKDEFSAIINTLLTLQSMGRFANYRLEDAKIDKPKKTEKLPPTPNVIKETPTPSPTPDEEPDGVNDQCDDVDTTNKTPEEIELSTILKIVTRTHQK